VPQSNIFFKYNHNIFRYILKEKYSLKKVLLAGKTNWIEKSCKSICVIQINLLPLHPQIRNDGGIAQLVRAHDS
jgi:hypothetical protein